MSQAAYFIWREGVTAKLARTPAMWYIYSNNLVYAKITDRDSHTVLPKCWEGDKAKLAETRSWYFSVAALNIIYRCIWYT